MVQVALFGLCMNYHFCEFWQEKLKFNNYNLLVYVLNPHWLGKYVHLLEFQVLLHLRHIFMSVRICYRYLCFLAISYYPLASFSH